MRSCLSAVTGPSQGQAQTTHSGTQAKKNYGADIFQPNYQGHAPIDRADGEVLVLFQKHLIITIRKHVGAAPADLAPLIASFLLAPPPPPPA